jgi:hypothetical protein
MLNKNATESVTVLAIGPWVAPISWWAMDNCIAHCSDAGHPERFLKQNSLLLYWKKFKYLDE